MGEDEVDAAYREVVEESEVLESDGHITRRSNPSNFVKQYSDNKDEQYPNVFFPSYKFFFDQETLEPPTAAEKAENVHELAENQDSLGINHPALLYKDGKYAEYEYIPGRTLEQEIDIGSEDLREIGSRIGEITRNLHSNDYARYDNRASNFIIDRSGIESSEPVPYFIDSEYVMPESSQADRDLDLVSFIDSINDKERETFDELFSGFREGYGDIPNASIALAGLRTSIEKMLERDIKKSNRSVVNTLSALYINRYGENRAENYQETSSGSEILQEPVEGFRDTT